MQSCAIQPGIFITRKQEKITCEQKYPIVVYNFAHVRSGLYPLLKCHANCHQDTFITLVKDPGILFLDFTCIFSFCTTFLYFCNTSSFIFNCSLNLL